MCKGHLKVSLHCVHPSPASKLHLPLGAVPIGLLLVASGRLRDLQHATESRRNDGELGLDTSLIDGAYDDATHFSERH